MTADMVALRRDFLPAHLKPEISAVGIDGVVAVQARSNLRETTWLLDLADEYHFIAGVVGWAAFASSTIRDELDRFASRPKLKGLRHILQEEPDDNYILHEDFNAGKVLPMSRSAQRNPILLADASFNRESSSHGLSILSRVA